MARLYLWFHLPPSLLHLLYILNSPIQILSPNHRCSLPTPFSFEIARTCLFKIKPSEDLEAKTLISYFPWTKAELPPIVKDFPKVTEDPHKLAEEFNIFIQTYQTGFSDLYQLVHMPIGKGQA